jgi:hypothetical protein
MHVFGLKQQRGWPVADVEVDQSGRTDVLTVDTALALSDELQRAILIPTEAQKRKARWSPVVWGAQPVYFPD